MFTINNVVISLNLASFLKKLVIKILLKFNSENVIYIKTIAVNMQPSLILLKLNALNADFKVPVRSLQKFIKKKRSQTNKFSSKKKNY